MLCQVIESLIDLPLHSRGSYHPDNLAHGATK